MAKNDPAIDVQQAKQFLQALYPDDVPASRFIYLWRLAGRASFWFRSTEQALSYVSSSNGRDTYLGCSMSTRDRGRHSRVSKAEAAGIVALWADIDWADPVHKKADSLPPTMEDALALLNEMPLKPSIVVNSGHGLQAFWLLDEPCLFDDEDERASVQKISYGWMRVLYRHASTHNWTVDSVFDLSRVMRVPGTLNAKDPSNVVLAKIVSIDGDARYSINDFDQFITTDDAAGAPMVVQHGQKKFDLDEAAQPPMEKLEILLENDERFRATWGRKRPDLKDQSPSAYDYSIASITALCGWTDQEIVNAINYNRKKHGDPLKHKRYYELTIQKVRASDRERQADQRIEELAFTGATTEVGGMSPAPFDSDKRKEALESLSNLWGFRIDAFIKMIASEPVYKVQTELGEITLGGVQTITSQTSFRNRIFAATNVLIGKRKNWDVVVAVIARAMEEVSIGEEATEAGAALAWLVSYVEEQHPGADKESAMRARTAFMLDGQLHLFLDPLRAFIRTSPEGGEVLSRQQLGVYLRSINGEPHTMAWRKTTRSVWRLPIEVTHRLMSNLETPPYIGEKNNLGPDGKLPS